MGETGREEDPEQEEGIDKIHRPWAEAGQGHQVLMMVD
jgi:hypothetical protein